MIKRSLFALALAAALPATAFADDGLSFTYVEADYVSTDVIDTELDGIAVRGNVGFHEKWYATGSWHSSTKNDVDIGLPDNVDVDFQQQTLGVGFHTAVANNVHFLAELAWLRYELDATLGGLSGTDGRDGYRGTVGMRALFGPKFEGEFKANYSDVETMDAGFGAEINAVFHINDTWGVAAGYQHDDLTGDDLEQWKLGVRASF